MLLFLCSGVSTAIDNAVPGVRSAALRESNIAGKTTTGQFLVNPALSAYAEHLIIDTWHSRLFGLKELPLSGGSLILPNETVNIGLSIQHFGHSLYQEMMLTANLSRAWESGIHAGGNLRYLRTDVQRYGNSSLFSLDAGFIYDVFTCLRFGGSISNMNHPAVNKFGEELSPIIRFGCAYDPADNATVYLAVQKDGAFQPEVSMGMEISPVESFTFFSGVLLNDVKPAAGILVKIKRVQMNYALQHHFELGATHVAGLSFVK